MKSFCGVVENEVTWGNQKNSKKNNLKFKIYSNKILNC